MKKSENHTWRFARVGGINRVTIESGQDLLHLNNLDQKLWTALSCPTLGLEFDKKTLELIDTDNDGRIRVPEILNAVNWICSLISNPDILINPKNDFPLSALDIENPESVQLLKSAKQILRNLGKENSESISVEETSDTTAIFKNTEFNGDGIITIESTSNDKIISIIQTIIDVIGFEIDRSGNKGVTENIVNTFYSECSNFKNWVTISETESNIILPFGNNTNEAFLLYLELKAKIDDYFLRCKLHEFEPETNNILNVISSRVESITNQNLTNCIEDIANYPIAKVTNQKNLYLTKGINPAWQKTISRFKELVINSLFPTKEFITEDDWNIIETVFTPYKSWLLQKKGALVETLGIATINEILIQNNQAEILELLVKDKELESEALNIILVDKLVRYYRDIYKLLKNFVTFHDFYSAQHKAIFQTGTLFLEQRSCDLCIKVSDMPKHSTMASLSGMYLIYCDCFSKTKNEKIAIVAAMTNGDIDNLVVGRNAIFYDNNGNDWDATITKIIENPISIRQAFWSPYRKIGKFVETQINKFASARENQVHASATENIEKTSVKAQTAAIIPTPTQAVPEPIKTTPQPFDIGKFVGIFAAIGMAIGAIGAVLASFISGFINLAWWKMPIALLGIVLVISGPSMIIAYLKLRKRNLAPLLDANGWAINAKAIINIPFGNTLTHLVSLPKNSRLDFKDPFKSDTTPIGFKIMYGIIIIGIIISLLWRFGYLLKWGIL